MIPQIGESCWDMIQTRTNALNFKPGYSIDECSTGLRGVTAWRTECAAGWLVFTGGSWKSPTVNQHSAFPHLQVEEKMTHTTSDAVRRDMVLAWTHLNSVSSKQTNASKPNESLHYWCVALTFSGALKLQLGMVNWHVSCQKISKQHADWIRNHTLKGHWCQRRNSYYNFDRKWQINRRYPRGRKKENVLKGVRRSFVHRNREDGKKTIRQLRREGILKVTEKKRCLFPLLLKIEGSSWQNQICLGTQARKLGDSQEILRCHLLIKLRMFKSGDL